MKNQRFDENRIRSTVLLGEEIIFRRLFPAIGREKAKFSLSFRYSEKLDTAELVFEGEDIPADIAEREYDEVSEKIVRSIAKEITSEPGKLTVKIN